MDILNTHFDGTHIVESKTDGYGITWNLYINGNVAQVRQYDQDCVNDGMSIRDALIGVTRYRDIAAARDHFDNEGI